MEIKLLFGREATLEDFYTLHDMRGFEFTIEDGQVTKVE